MLQAAAKEGNPYRFAILDMHMPNVDGMAIGAADQSRPADARLILISLSSISDQMKPKTMNQSGFSAWLTKLPLPSQLYDAIVNSLAANQSPSSIGLDEPNHFEKIRSSSQVSKFCLPRIMK